ncbi:hypothetical protein LOTGIDRAFT_164534 [Lottia gigantea]|uniref:Endonuclease/exonuclease/phosphatase domain-containing protein n=1 Tax=Lottia gigantea TaxID=225164 RepID=V4A9A0_LOTGI|nr:hypothetical protein LOTGIDRAFT_164534 [Lottia gigantea]ESO89846.1 hypothetical protein LOTGIDRAFT_164534 [Lottia gigantea]
MSDMKADIDSEISELETKILKLENEKLESDRTLTHYVHELETMRAKLPIELDSIVIKNMPELASEKNDNRVTIYRVTRLFKEGLKLPNINIINADRKKTSSHKPGVIVVQLQDSAHKKLVLETKSKLNTNKQFDKIYIESSMSTAELKTQSSLITLVKELGKQDSYFVKESVINEGNFDVLFLCETFLRFNEKIAVNGYKWLGRNRDITHKKAKRGSGHVGFLIRNNIYDEYHVSILDESLEDILWIKLAHKSSDTYVCLCVCYLPPNGSSYMTDAEQFYNNLLNQVYSFQNEGLVCISGDFNSRVGDQSDYILGVDNLPPRAVIDYTENSYGTLFTDFLCDTNLCMLNGRISGRNDFTYVSTNGRSVVDYVVAPHEQVSLYSDFQVWRMSELISYSNLMVPEKIPDHSLLVFTLNIAGVSLSGTNSHDHISGAKPKPKLHVPENFLSECTPQILEKISAIETNLRSEHDINLAYKSFAEFIINEMSAPIAEGKGCKKLTNRKRPYWNEALEKHWKMVQAKCKSKLRKSHLHGAFIKERKGFDKSLRQHKRHYLNNKQSELLEQFSVHDKRDFWKSFGKIGIANDRKHVIPLEVTNSEGELEMHKTDNNFYNLSPKEKIIIILSSDLVNPKTISSYIYEMFSRRNYYMSYNYRT